MAVYTDVTNDELDAFLSEYAIGELVSLKGIAEGVENSNFLVVTTRANFILTLYEKRVVAGDLPFFLNLMEHLAQHGIDCPLPVHDKSGQVLKVLAERPAAIVTFLQGVSVRRPKPAHCALIGEALAKLHLAGANFNMLRPNALGPEGWRHLFASFAHRAGAIGPGFRDDLARELDTLQEAWPASLPQGVIHADLFPDNVFFLENRLSGIIDFYFACNDMLAYDLAICLNAWCFEPDFSFNMTKARQMFDGYQSVRPLTPEEAGAMPLLARGAALRFLLTRSYDWLHTNPEALVHPKDPHEYRRKLKFHQTVRTAAEYGFPS
jgi:homoserine kinase type II